MTTQTDKFVEFLAARPNRWVPMPVLVEVTGSYAVHSRAADARELGYTVENRVDRKVRPARSFYRIVQAEEVAS
jgi:hypothetical protein